MNLGTLAEADNAILLEDVDCGFARAIKITDLATPTPNVYNVNGLYFRVGIDIDPDTGLLVPGNKSSITVRLASLGSGVYPDEGWIVETTDSTGAAVKKKIAHALLDRTAGRMTAILKG